MRKVGSIRALSQGVGDERLFEDDIEFKWKNL